MNAMAKLMRAMPVLCRVACACMHVCMHVYVCMHMCMHMDTHMRICVYTACTCKGAKQRTSVLVEVELA